MKCLLSSRGALYIFTFHEKLEHIAIAKSVLFIPNPRGLKEHVSLSNQRAHEYMKPHPDDYPIPSPYKLTV